MTRLMGRGVAPGMAVGRARGRRARGAAGALPARVERRRSRAAAAARRRASARASSSRRSPPRVARTVGLGAGGDLRRAAADARRSAADAPGRRADPHRAHQRATGRSSAPSQELHELFAREGDAWLRERVGDLADVGGRLQRNLRPGRDPLVDLDPASSSRRSSWSPTSCRRRLRRSSTGRACAASSPTSAVRRITP